MKKEDLYKKYDCRTFVNPKTMVHFLNERLIPKEDIISITANGNEITIVFMW